MQKKAIGLVLLLLCLSGMSGCKWLSDAKKAVLGGGDDTPPPRRVASRPKADPAMEKLKWNALEKVKKHKSREGWTIAKEVKNYEKIAVRIAKKKQLPRPTGFDWSALCAKTGTCRVTMEFWDGRKPIQAIWMVSGEIRPLNCWAYSFGAQFKQAQACFKRKAEQEARKRPNETGTGGVWENAKGKGKNGKKGTKAGAPAKSRGKVPAARRPAPTRKKPAAREKGDDVWNSLNKRKTQEY
jgi:hypothetical protein